MSHRSLLAVTATTLFTLLAACGGGGGGASPGSATAGAAAAPATVAQIVPAATMTWATVASPTLQITVRRPDGAPASGAAVRAFTLSRSSPQDGSALLEPVPVALLESAATGADGRLTLALRLPSTQTEVLLVATQGDLLVQRAVRLDAATTTVELSLAP